MNVVNATRRRGYLAVVLALVMLVSSFGTYVPRAEAAMTIMWFEPAATLVSSDASGDYYRVNDAIQPDKVHFWWNFSNGMDRPINAGSLQYVTLWKKNKDNNNTEIPLVRKFVDSGGDFWYTKGGGSGSSGGTRLLELILQSTTLQPGTTYIVKLGADLQANNGSTLEKPYSWEFTTIGSVVDAGPPTWPANSILTAAFAPTFVDLEWPEATDENGITTYKIWQGNSELGTVDGYTRKYRATGLRPATAYSFKVEACDGAGNWSTTGPSATVTTAEIDTVEPVWPEDAQLICSKVANNSLTLNWTAAVDNSEVSSYKIFQNGQELASVAGNLTSYKVTGLTLNTEYTFKVEAGDSYHNWTSNGPSAVATTIEDLSPPTWPSGSTLNYSNLQPRTVTLEWTVAEDNIEVVSYQIFQNGNPIATVNDGTTCNVTGLNGNTSYTFMVQACDAQGQSADGPTVTLTTEPWSPTEGAGFGFTLTSPASSNISLDDSRAYNHIIPFVNPDEVYFCWDLENGLDEAAYLQNISLKKKDSGDIIPLAASDFKYTKENEPEKIRRLELTLAPGTLAKNTSYILELGPDFSANNGTKLGRAYCWEFQTWPGTTRPASQIASSGGHSAFLDSSGHVWTWGNNEYGQLGDGTKINRSTPLKVEGLTGVVAICNGFEHSLALRDDGSVWSWGGNRYGQLGDGAYIAHNTAKVEGLTGVVAICSNGWHSMALRQDGSVWTWGRDHCPTPVKVEGLTRVVDISVGVGFSLALRDDGSVWAWGINDLGQLGDGTTTGHATPVKVEGLSGVVDISAGGWNSYALCGDGSVWAWGCNNCGQLGDGTTTDRTTPVKLDALTGMTAISGGGWHSMALSSDGSVWTWGRNYYGTLGDGTQTDRSTPAKLEGLTGVAAICAGYEDSLALRDDTTIWAWGNGYQFFPAQVLLDLADTTAPEWPTESALTVSDLGFTGLTLTWPTATDERTILFYRVLQNEATLLYPEGNVTTCNITGLEPGKEYTFKVQARDNAGNWSNCLSTTVSTVVDTTPPVWPENAALTYSDVTYSSLKLAWPVATDNVRVLYRLYCGEEVLAEVGSDNLSYCVTGLKSSTEYAFRVEAGDGSGNWTSGPSCTVTTAINPTQGAGFDFAMSGLVSANVSVSDTLVYNRVHDLLDPKNVRLSWLFSKKLDEAACRQNFSLKNKNTGEAITLAADNLVFSQEGEQYRLELVPGDLAYEKASDYIVELGPNFAAGDGTLLGKTYSWEFATWPQRRMQTCLASGLDHTLILRDDGTVFSCGNNKNAQLGDGTTGNCNVPVPVTGLSGIVSVSAGDTHSVALKEDGTVWAWGRGKEGQLGNGSTTTKKTPTQVSDISGAIGVVAQGRYTAVLKNDGTVWTFGQNNYGQLGDGTKTNRNLPGQVPGLKDIIVLAGGSGHMMALQADGNLWVWGNNASGQLGDGTTTGNLNPLRITDTDSFTAIAAGGEYNLALKDDGSLWTWGNNASGQLGNGSTENSSVPSKVETAPAGIKSITAGSNFAAVCSNDGKIWMWGNNASGQLGRGTIGSQELLPVQIESLSSMIAVGAGGNHAVALKNDGCLWAWGKNDKGQLGDGNTTDRSVPVAVWLASTASPFLQDARTSVDGKTINLKFDKAMTDPKGITPAFAVSVDGIDNPVTAVTLKTENTLELTLTNSISPGSVVVISYTIGTLTSSDGNILGSFKDIPVTSRVAAEIYTADIEVGDSNKTLGITDNTPDTSITVPQDIEDAKMYLDSKLNAPAGGVISTRPLPELNIAVNTTISANPVQMTIASGTSVSAADSWDGTLNLPTVKANNSVTVTPDAGKTAAVNRVIEIGCGDTALNFDKAVKIVIPGEAGKEIGFVRGGVFQKIDTVLTATTQDAVDAELLTKGKLDGKQDQGNDLVVWTKHFTSFVTYTQTVTNPGGGGTTPGGGGNGDGSGGNAGDRDFWVEHFTLVKNSSSSYTLRFDLSNGMDREVPGNLSKVHVYKKSDRTLIPYTSYNYIKQGTRDNPPKIRRLELTFNNLFKDGESYLVEIDPDFTANNSNTFGSMYTTEFTIGATTVMAPVAGNNGSFGSAGGTLNGENATIVIPAGAFSSDIKITIEKVSNISSLPGLSGGKILGSVVEIKADRSGEFNQAVTITLTFDKTLVDLEKNRVSIYWLDEKTGKWNELKNVKVDTSAGTVSGEINHFTKFTAMAVEKAKQEKEPEVVPVLAPVINLNDIKGHWAQAQIEKLVVAGAISGYPDSTFKPDQTISRAEFAAVLVKAFKLEAKNGKVFKDTANHWAKDAIATAAAYGIVSGYDADTFAPDEFITREQMAVMISKAANLTVAEGGKNFSDKEQVSDWARDAVNKASGHKIISGYPDNSFRPKANASRAEAVTVIAKAS